MATQSRKGAASPPQAAKRKKVDWPAVERDYRTGKFTLRELEAKHGVDNAQIARRKKAEGWSQDLSEAVRVATNARLMSAIVSKEVSAAQQSVSTAILEAAEVNTQVILAHRHGLQRITRIKEALLGQIEQAAQLMPDLAEAIEMVRQPDDNGTDRANDALRRAMGRSALVDDLKKLAEVDERVRKGEREAFNITGPAEEAKKDGIADFIAELSARGSRLPTKGAE